MTFMIPFPVIMIPLFVLVRNFGWVNTYWGLIIPGALTGFAVFMMRQFIQAIPGELIDAARIDGAGGAADLPHDGPAAGAASARHPRDPHVPGELE